jgi:hypothetical protein
MRPAGIFPILELLKTRINYMKQRRQVCEETSGFPQQFPIFGLCAMPENPKGCGRAAGN